MAVDFFFDPPTVAIPPLGQLRIKWIGITDLTVRAVIAQEEQYLCYHRAMLERVHSTEAGALPNPTWRLPLDISVRAGAVKAAALVCGSIVEAALRHHAERRHLPLPTNLRRRTFGRVLAAWETEPATPHADVAAVWADVKRLHELRNNIHLFCAAEGNTDFNTLLTQERDILAAGERAVEHLAALRSP
jgi:hypothetical protein